MYRGLARSYRPPLHLKLAHQHGALQMLVPLLLARAPPPPAGTPTTPVLATLSPLLGAPAFLRLHVKLKHESIALC